MIPEDDILEDSEFAPEDQQEDLSDLNLEGSWFHGAVLWSTDWTTETILSQLNRGNIDLNPRYQRRSAWRANHKSRFIESLILGLPIPQIILAEDKKKKGSFIVIDGKQRLLSLRQFTAEDKDKDKGFDLLRLEGLEDRPDLNGKIYADLKAEKYSNELNTFENQTIRTVVIRNWNDERYLYSVFLRINTGSVKLSPQELRQAISPGPFSDFIDDFSVGSKALKDALGLERPDFRMRDTELALRFLAYKNKLPEYSGNLKAFLDSFTKDANEHWRGLQESILLQTQQLDAAIEATKTIFGEKKYLRKWNGDRYERRVNRAVFDIMTYYFSDKSIREAAISAKDKIESHFRALCNDNPSFRSALETTTKSLMANAVRFEIWGDELQSVLKKNIAVPRLVENRLKID